MQKIYSPSQGDIIWVCLTGYGHELLGEHPAVVINRKISLIRIVPITSKFKDNLEYCQFRLPNYLNTKGVALIDQIQTFDWQARHENSILRFKNERLKTQDISLLVALIQKSLLVN